MEINGYELAEVFIIQRYYAPTGEWTKDARMNQLYTMKRATAILAAFKESLPSVKYRAANIYTQQIVEQ